MFSRRLQILLDEERYERLARRARETKRSVAAVIREAIDTAVPASRKSREAAARAILDAEPMEVPDPVELREQLEELRARRG